MNTYKLHYFNGKTEVIKTEMMFDEIIQMFFGGYEPSEVVKVEQI